MSNHLAISAVTLTLRDLLHEQVVGAFTGAPSDLAITQNVQIGMVSPDKVRTPTFPSENVINLMLYRTEINGGLRNMPGRNARPGEVSEPPVAINLDYLISIFPEGDKEAIGHYFLGQVLRILHDEPILARERIRAALEIADLHRQVERVTITPRTLSIDDMSKLWSSFMVSYRLSAAYLVTVVLIDSLRPDRKSVPVLTRGKDDRGVFSDAGGILAISDVKPASKLASVSSVALTTIGVISIGSASS